MILLKLNKLLNKLRQGLRSGRVTRNMLNIHLIKAGHSQHAEYTFNQSRSLVTCWIYILSKQVTLNMLNKHFIKAGHSQHAEFTFNQSRSLLTCWIYFLLQWVTYNMLNIHLIKAGHSQLAEYTFYYSGSLTTCWMYIYLIKAGQSKHFACIFKQNRSPVIFGMYISWKKVINNILISALGIRFILTRIRIMDPPSKKWIQERIMDPPSNKWIQEQVMRV